MFRKNYLIFVLMITAVLFGSIAAFAQSSSISGRVQIDEKGTKKPAPNVTVEAYRVDTMKADSVSATTDEKGDFKIENLPSGKKFALAVSGESIEVSIVTDVASDAANLAVTVQPGTSKRPSKDTVFQSLLAGGKLEISAAEKAEADAELKKIEEKNAKASNVNEVTKRAIEEGNKAYKDKNYDLAIAKYDEGYQADNDFVGSAPTFLNNKGAALQKRAIEYHNKSVTAGADKEAKLSFYKKSSEDFSNAIDTYYASLTVLNKATDAEKKSTQDYKDNKMKALTGARDVLELAYKTQKGNPEKLDKAKTLIEEYVKAESDGKKKVEAMTILANYYVVSGDFDAAIAEFRKVLAESPKEPGALFGLGISLISTGYNDDGSIKKTQIQEAVNMLKRFKDVASSDTFKKEIADADSTLNDQKVANNITPKN